MSGPSFAPAQPIPRWMIALLLALAALRLPAFVEPVGSDQSLYLYIGQRALAGDVPYVDAWDQKPPAVYAIYAALWTVWPRESVVALADLLAAAATAWLLVAIGRRTFGGRTGAWAAAIFLIGSHPGLMRLGGVYVRGQCEVFISVAIAAALLVLAHRQRTFVRSLLAGLWFGIAIWIKFNAVAYVLPIAVAAWYWDSAGRDWRTWLRDLVVIAGGVVAVSAVPLIYFAAHDALEALKLATIDYNVRYAGDAYAGTTVWEYVATLPWQQAHVNLLWFLGGAGAIGLIVHRRADKQSRAVILAWIVAAIASIAINGARGLPQYFVQAAPALACAAAMAGGVFLGWGGVGRWLALIVITAGLWRVGVEGDRPVRFGDLPNIAESLLFDVNYARGRITRDTFLGRFRGQQKYDAPEIDALTVTVRTTTLSSDRIFVFGFSPGVYAFSGRASASRFFWSRPVIIEFAADHPGYGSAGLLNDLRQRPPALVALQKQDWGGPGEPHSRDFFLANSGLRLWLEAGYTRESESAMFSVWRRKS